MLTHRPEPPATVMKPTPKILLSALALLILLLFAGCETSQQDPRIQIHGDSNIRLQSTVR